MADPTTTSFDTFLKVWAIVGPLMVGVASAMWSRRIQIGDRDYERIRDQERGDREKTLKRQEHEDTIRKEKYNGVKSGLADFMASSHEYVRKQSEYMTTPLPERHQAATAANDKFVHSCQIVTLLGSDAVASAATDLWNATLIIPKSYSAASPPDYDEKLRVYRAARAVFNDTARAYLTELETGAHS